MQNAKDTFYEILRDRVAVADASLTTVLRGTVRPAVVVEENELATTSSPLDCFVLRWTEAAVDSNGPMPVERLRCEVRYATAGTGAGMDRGRRLSAMDEALLTAVNTGLQCAAKKDYSALATGGDAVTMHSQIWWGDLTLGPVKAGAKMLERIATVEVSSLQEAGEA